MNPNARPGDRAIPQATGVFQPLRKLAFFLLFIAGFLAACGSLSGPKYPTLIPTEYVPTAIALTVEAGRAVSAKPLETLPGAPAVPTGTATSRPSAAATLPGAPGLTATADQPSATPTESPGASPAASATPRLPTLTLTAGEATLAPSLTAPALTGTEGLASTQTPGLFATPTPTLRLSRTLTPTATPGIPNATVLLYNPGPLSKETSPIQLSASLQPGPGGSVLIELVGEGGRNLYRKLIRYTTQDWVLISEDVDFNIAAAAEAARLQISTQDAEGRLMALASVDLLLLSVGEDDLNPPTDLLEPLIIREPLPNTLIMGGKVVVTGLARTSGDQPLLVELINPEGSVVGYRQAVTTLPFDPWATQGYATFRAEVPYSVEGATWVRLAVSAFEDNLTGATHLSSVLILLGP
jgi:hypothetical protein